MSLLRHIRSGSEWGVTVDFVAIDFETANERRDSACAVAIAVVSDSTPLRTKSWLIRPEPSEFAGFNVMLHGITEAHVAEAPTFPEIWSELKLYIGDKLVIAHNASFDMSVLRHLFGKYSIDHPPIRYYCTRTLSRAAYPGMISYTLELMAERLRISYMHPHDPACDAAAAAELALHCCNQLGAPSIEAYFEASSITCGQLFPGGYRSWRHPTSSGVHPRDLKPDSDDLDPSHPFYGKTIVFTGALDGMPRSWAMQRVVNAGGECGLSVTKKTDFLIVGQQDFRKFRGGNKSSKMRKAEDLLSKGVEIEILPEPEFMRML
jgi:DNA polymerase-3 subunit epsilon